MSFEPHGTLKLTWINHILLHEIQGPVNLEASIRFNEQIKQALISRSSEHWVRMEWFYCPEMLGTQDSLEELDKSFAFAAQQGCKDVVLVNANSLMQSLFSSRSHQFGMNCQAFDNIFDAISAANKL